jgi:hypothetical protein
MGRVTNLEKNKIHDTCIYVKNNRVENQQKFAQHMKEYLRDRTVKKYGIENTGGLDLMSITRN